MVRQELIDNLPLSRTWLENIVDSLLKRPNGEGEIDSIVNALMRTNREIGTEAESTVTRTINNYCRNAGDTEKKAKHELFERIGPGKYRLLTYPSKPDLIEIQRVQFSDPAYQQAWDYFCKQASKDTRWKTATKRKRLEAFSKNLISSERLRGLIQAYGGEPPTII